MRAFSPETVAFIQDAYPRWKKVQADFLAAGLSYFSLFSLAPMLLLMLTITGTVVAQPKMQGIILEKISIWISPEATVSLEEWMSKQSQKNQKNAMRPQLEDVQKAESRKTRTTIFGLFLLAFGASQALHQARRIINFVWEVPARDHSFWKKSLHTGFFNIAMLIAVGFFLMTSLAMDGVVGFAWNKTHNLLPDFLKDNILILQSANFLTSLTLIGILLALCYRYLPDAKVYWRDVWPGALITAILLAIGKVGISLYLSLSGFQSLYGAASSILVLLFSIHAAAHIFIVGAVITRTWSVRYGHHPKPHHPRTKHAS